MNDTQIFWKYVETKFTNSPRGIIFLTHGFRAHGSIHRGLVRYFLKSGYHVVIWDLPSHGRSGGERGFITDFSVCIRSMLFVLAQVLRKDHNLPIYLIAHSAGASVTILSLRYLLQSKKTRVLSRIHGIIAIDPAFHVLHNVSWFIRILRPFAFVLLWINAVRRLPVSGWNPDSITNDRRVIEKISKDRRFYGGPLFLKTAYEIYRAGERSWKALEEIEIPMLFVYGKDDTVTPPIAPSEFSFKTPRALTIKTYQDRKHNPLDGYGAEEVWKDIHLWIQRRESTHEEIPLMASVLHFSVAGA